MDLPARSFHIRRSLALLVFSVPLALGGCAHQYLMKLTDGDQIISYTRPDLQGADYHFTDAAGTPYVLPKSRVTKIQSVTVVKEEKKSASPPAPYKPKHWYFLWLA